MLFKRSILIGICCSLTLLLAGCFSKQTSSPNEGSYSEVEQTKKYINKNAKTDSKDTAHRMTTLAIKFPFIEKAYAISAGKYSIVGLDVDKTLPRNRVSTLKYSVAQALKEDPQGSNVLVTADIDLVQRIKELGQEIKKGKPFSGLMTQIANIASRITPQPSKATEKN